MEYSLLKQIETPIGYLFANSTYPHLTPYPAQDFVNPGLANVARIHNFMVPLHVQDNLHNIKKQITEISELEGNLTTEELKTNLKDQIGTGDDDNDNDIIQKQINSDPETFNERKRMLLGDSVYQSFLQPKKLKIGEIKLDSPIKAKTTSNKPQKELKHKFSFV